MADFDINVLLAEAKDDPRFLKLTTNTLKFGSTALSNDPIVSGVDGGALPTLFASTSNTPGLFDVRIEFFILLREAIENSITITDLFAFSQDKNLNDFLGFSEFIKIKAPFNIPNEKLLAVDRAQLTSQGKDFRDFFSVSDEVEDPIFTQNRRFENLITSIAQIKRKIVVDFHHKNTRGNFRRPLTELMALLYNPSSLGGLKLRGQGFVGHHSVVTYSYSGIFSAPGLDYTYPSRRGHYYIPNGYVASSSDFTISSFGATHPFNDNINKMYPHFRWNGIDQTWKYNTTALRPEQYHLETGVPITGISAPVYDWEKYAPWAKKWYKENFPNVIYGKVYWWMPGYFKDFRPFGGPLYVADPFDEDKRGWGNATLKDINEGELYFWEMNVLSYNARFQGYNAYLVNWQNYPDTPDFTYDTRLLKTKEGSNRGEYNGSLAETISRIFSFGHTQVRQDEIAAVVNVLNPKAKDTRSKVKINADTIKFFQTKTVPESFMESSDRVEAFKITTAIREFLASKELTLTPKALSFFERILFNERRTAKQTINLKKSLVETFDRHAKKAALGKEDSAELRQDLLNSGKFILTLEKLKAASTNKLKAETSLKSLLDTVDLENFQINRNLFEEFKIKEIIIPPYEHKETRSKAKTKSFTTKQTDKPLLVKVDTLSTRTFDTVKFLDTESLIRSLIVKPVNSYIQSDRLFLETELKFDPRFNLESHFEVEEDRQSKDVSKLISPPEKLKARQLILQGKAELFTEALGAISKDRDAGGFGDVLFDFKTQILLQFMELKEQRLSKDFATPKEDNVTSRENVLYSGRFKELNSRTSSNDLLHSFEVTKALIEKLIEIIDTDLVKDTEKPIRTVGKLKELLLTNPASFEYKLSRFLVNDSFNPYLMVKDLEEDVELVEAPSKNFDTGITEILSPSIKGYAFMRDEDYVEGAYFLQPYVATIPPGRSRQF